MFGYGKFVLIVIVGVITFREPFRLEQFLALVMIILGKFFEIFTFFKCFIY